jgi:hypothetical protein
VGTAHTVKTKLKQGEDPAAPARGEGTQRTTGSGGVQRRTIEGGSRERLQSVRKDPSLRSSDLGKELLRLLHAQDAAESKIAMTVEAIPPHLMPIVSELALQYAASWSEFALMLQERWRRQAEA